jgi:AcrR family transcriptional regulator
MHEEPRAARWRRRKEARPAEIVEAALASFAERGFAATRLDDIAARAGITKGTLYLYFESKEDLFKALVRETLIPNLARFEALAATAQSPVALLEQLIRAWPKLIAARPIGAIPKLVLTEAGNFPDLARFYLEEVIGRGRELIAGILRRGIEAGEMRADLDVEHVTTCVIGPLLLSALWKHSFEPHDPHGPMDREALAETHISLLRRGLLVEKEASQ